MDLFNDPIFKTTTKNYDFKYIDKNKLDEVIENVNKKRSSKNESIWNSLSDKPKTAPHGILKNSIQEFIKPSNEIKNSSIRSLNADEINEFKMLDYPRKLKIPPPPTTIQKIVEKPQEESKVEEQEIVDCKIDLDDLSFEESEVESVNPNKKPISSRSSRINYLNVSSNESLRSSKICGKRLSKRNSTERYKRNQSDEQIPISAREKQEIEKHFGSFNKPSTASYNSRSNSQTESNSEEEILETTESPTKNKIKQKNIQKILELIELKNRKQQKKLQEDKLSMYLSTTNDMFGHRRVSNSRTKRSQNPVPSQNFIKKNIQASSTNLRKTISHRIISSKSVAKHSPPIEGLKFDQEPIETMMEAVKSSEEKIISATTNSPELNQSILTALEAITKRNIHDILGPLLANLGLSTKTLAPSSPDQSKINTELNSMQNICTLVDQQHTINTVKEVINTNSDKFTEIKHISDVDIFDVQQNPKLKQVKNHDIRIDKNNLFSFVTSNLKNSNDTINDSSCFEQNNKKKTSDEENEKLEKFEKLKEQVLSDRKLFRKKQKKNSLYFNEQFKEPWKVISRIADKILDEAIMEVGNEIDFGEENIVRDFLKLELN